MTLMPMYTAKWVWEAANRDERQVKAAETRLARVLCSPGENKQRKERSRPQKSALKRLLTSLEQARA
jgi:hypothetical protein